MDYYKILELDRNASQSEIKKNYRKMARKYHPDTSKEENADSKFKEVQEAYEVLSDPQKKSNYDKYGDPNGQPNMGFDFNDIFSNFGFGGFGGFNNTRKNEPKGKDINISVKLDYDEIINGTTKKIKYKRDIKCSSCSGSGGESTTCTSCNGAGHNIHSSNTPFGTTHTRRTCSSCNGEGIKIINTCNTCNGNGSTQEETIRELEIEPGMVNMTVAYQDYGSYYRGGKYGNLNVSYSPKEHPNWSIDIRTNNIIVNIKENIFSFILGKTIVINTPVGEKSISIEEGHNGPKQIILHNSGIPLFNYNGRKSHMIINIEPEIKKLIKEDRELIQNISSKY